MRPLAIVRRPFTESSREGLTHIHQVNSVLLLWKMLQKLLLFPPRNCRSYTGLLSQKRLPTVPIQCQSFLRRCKERTTEFCKDLACGSLLHFNLLHVMIPRNSLLPPVTTGSQYLMTGPETSNHDYFEITLSDTSVLRFHVKPNAHESPNLFTYNDCVFNIRRQHLTKHIPPAPHTKANTLSLDHCCASTSTQRRRDTESVLSSFHCMYVFFLMEGWATADNPTPVNSCPSSAVSTASGVELDKVI